MIMNKYKKDAIVFKAFCDESRLRIIELIKKGETCSCVLLEDLTISQSTLSHHMKILSESGIVISRIDGKRTMYRISEEAIAKTLALLEDILIFNDSIKTECDCTSKKKQITAAYSEK